MNKEEIQRVREELEEEREAKMKFAGEAKRWQEKFEQLKEQAVVFERASQDLFGSHYQMTQKIKGLLSTAAQKENVNPQFSLSETASS